MQPSSLELTVQPTSGVPIYRQLMDQIRALLSSGRLKPGDRLPSVRQVAADLQVNMMTVSKAYAKLEADGVIERERGVGMRVPLPHVGGRGMVADEKLSVSDRQQQLKPFAEELATRAWQLNLTDEQTLAVVKSVLKERKS
jgi:GntR family transcriptional regulator